MPFNTFNSVAKLPKKGSSIPSITFSNPSLVTTTTHWVTDASYRVFLIEGSDLEDNSTFTTNATLTNWSSNITIYFLCIGAGGAAYGGGNGYGYGGGGGGGGGFLDGSANIPGTPGIKNVLFSVPARFYNSSGNDAQMFIRNDTSSITYLYAAAGGGGRGGITVDTDGASGRNPSGTGQVVKKKQGNGGGGGQKYNNNDTQGFYSGQSLNKGANGDTGSGGGGGGSGGNASGRNGGVGSTVSSTTLGIKQKFGSNTFCAGGQGAIGKAMNPSATASLGASGVGLYGCGGGGNVNNSYYISGQKGAIAIAISMNDVPL